MSDTPPHFRVHGDSSTGEVHGWTEGGEATGSRHYLFPNVNEEDLPGFPTGYRVDDRHGWARLLAPDGTVLDEETHTVKGWAW